MDLPEVFSTGGLGGNRSQPIKELQGPRPAVLKVNKNSYKIRKPQVMPPTSPPEDRRSVIIHAVSPKVTHTTVIDFMKLVQALDRERFLHRHARRCSEKPLPSPE
ncbi:hypothetical protein F511_08654 [Dorcoceras hygrometricum]|uniref:VQ domain-containing protein n=1 Tax=Dorcoceras hygrometricum TaxID=472368 RepID=A0A2Z7AAV5_9LAMI|nr:hypothetical protein F511_08654 [Dorcoceras hygrometricum]